MAAIEMVVSLVTGLFGGVAVVLLNREKTKAEIVKLTQEADFLRAQTDKIKGDVTDVKATQGKQKRSVGRNHGRVPPNVMGRSPAFGGSHPCIRPTTRHL